MSGIKFKGFSTEGGKIVPTGYLDGYSFGDRLLEGVRFKCEVLPTGKLEVSPAGLQDEDYLRSLNKKKWIAEAKAFAEADYNKGADIFSSEPNGGESLVLERL